MSGFLIISKGFGREMAQIACRPVRAVGSLLNLCQPLQAVGAETPASTVSCQDCYPSPDRYAPPNGVPVFSIVALVKRALGFSFSPTSIHPAGQSLTGITLSERTVPHV